NACRPTFALMPVMVRRSGRSNSPRCSSAPQRQTRRSPCGQSVNTSASRTTATRATRERRSGTAPPALEHADGIPRLIHRTIGRAVGAIQVDGCLHRRAASDGERRIWRHEGGEAPKEDLLDLVTIGPADPLHAPARSTIRSPLDRQIEGVAYDRGVEVQVE